MCTADIDKLTVSLLCEIAERIAYCLNIVTGKTDDICTYQYDTAAVLTVEPHRANCKRIVYTCNGMIHLVACYVIFLCGYVCRHNLCTGKACVVEIIGFVLHSDRLSLFNYRRITLLCKFFAFAGSNFFK